MGNSITQARDSRSSTITSTAPRSQRDSVRYTHRSLGGDDVKSKTLPARTSRQSRLSDNNGKASRIGHTEESLRDDIKTSTQSTPPPPPPPNGETSRILFLLYLIHRTWNVVVGTMDSRDKRSRRSGPSSEPCMPPTKYFGDVSSCGHENYSIDINDLDEIDTSSQCCSQYSNCTCSYCYNMPQNVYNSIEDECTTDSICQGTLSNCESDFSLYYRHQSEHFDYQNHQSREQRHQMAPSVCQNSPKLHQSSAGGRNVAVVTVSSAPSLTQKSNCGSHSLNGSMASYQLNSNGIGIVGGSSCGAGANGSSVKNWPTTQTGYSKENQRPPVYNPEDYAQSLKKFGKRQSGSNVRSIYDTSETAANDGGSAEETYKSSTLPGKHSEYKSPIPSPPESECEMSLRQFASVTDLLTKLRSDLRSSFPSFVQEFVATPSDGISLLLEVLRAIQLSQATNSLMPLPQMSTATMPRNPQSYQRRALLDELACLQCLSVCCTRSVDATARLGTTPVGLIALASSATGQGIRARILAMQLMTAACDRKAFGHGSQKIVTAGHVAVSEAMSTLRLRCSEPVRFRLLVGMLNSGGGSGELQAVGVRFINVFLESSENLQQRLYLQAELFQAGFEPSNLAKTISSTSPWLDSLRGEIKRFNEIYVDVDKMIAQARDADRVRSQMVILERRVQILHEEKAVLTSMERRLQERCADLQREIFRLQGAQSENTFKSLDKQQPVALPRHVPPGHSKQDSSEHEDEGISSSETGPSLSPVPILVLPQKPSGGLKLKTGSQQRDEKAQQPSEEMPTIEGVMEELDNVVSEAEKQISTSNSIGDDDAKEQDIVPVNIVPQPPRKSRSLAHLVSQPGGSDLDATDYGMLMIPCPGNDPAVAGASAAERVAAMQTFFDEADYDMPEIDKPYTAIESPDIPEVNMNTLAYNASTTRELLDVIMNARHSDDDPTIKAFREGGHHHHHCHQQQQPQPQQQPQQQQLPPQTTAIHKRSGCGGGPSKKAPAPPPPPPPAQHFNGVFFMTNMNTPQKYPKPDLTAVLQARRVTKNVERLEAVFAGGEATNEGSNSSGGGGRAIDEDLLAPPPKPLREKSRSNQQIYFGSNPSMRINGYTVNAATPVTTTTATARTRSSAQGSKVTDTPSGLY